MDFKDIVAISGKGGLFKIVRQTGVGFIVESIDKDQKKFAVSARDKVSVLKDISIYTTEEEGSKSIENVFQSIHEKYQKKLPVDSKSSREDLMQFIQDILPQMDAERVYPSDVKKVVSWYVIILEHYPDLLSQKEEKKAEDVNKKTAEKKTTKKASGSNADTSAKKEEKAKPKAKKTSTKKESKE